MCWQSQSQEGVLTLTHIQHYFMGIGVESDKEPASLCWSNCCSKQSHGFNVDRGLSMIVFVPADKSLVTLESNSIHAPFPWIGSHTLSHIRSWVYHFRGTNMWVVASSAPVRSILIAPESTTWMCSKWCLLTELTNSGISFLTPSCKATFLSFHCDWWILEFISRLDHWLKESMMAPHSFTSHWVSLSSSITSSSPSSSSFGPL